MIKNTQNLFNLKNLWFIQFCTPYVAVKPLFSQRSQRKQEVALMLESSLLWCCELLVLNVLLP